MSEKTKGEELREKLFYQPKNLSEVLSHRDAPPPHRYALTGALPFIWAR